MTSVFSYRPEYFNFNGDQGNLEVLKYATGADLTFTSDPMADLLLVGDASRAALREFENELLELVPIIEKRLQNGDPTLLVGSSYEFFAKRSELLPDLVNGKRFSGFVKLTHEDFEVVGYRNSEVVGSELFVKGGFIGTLMFGPILAKNPDLLKLLAREMQLEIRLGNSYWDLVSEVRRNLTFG